MKNKLALLYVGLFVLLSGCGSNTNVIEGEVKTVSSGEALPQTEENEMVGKKQEQKTEVSEQPKGYIFNYEDIVIEIDAEAESVIEQLGEANTYFEAPSCAFEGIDKMYTYNSFELDTYPMNGIDLVSAIVFKDDTVTTSEGIGIGDSIEKVTETYGEDMTNENGMMAYVRDGMKLCFIIREDTVVSVEYRSTVLDE